MLAPYVSSGRLTILVEHELIAPIRRRLVRAVTVPQLSHRNERVITARYFLDATEFGDLLPLSGTEFVTGAESQSETGEPAPKRKLSPATCKPSPSASR